MGEENANYNEDLHRAAAEGHLDAIERLLSRGTAVDSRTSCGWTPLMQAVRGGHATAVASLLAHGADVNAFNELGGSVLSVAAAVGDTKLFRLLLEAGVEAGQRRTAGVPPLVAAAAHGHQQLVELLIDKGCSVNDSVPVSGATPLHVAVAGLHVGCVRVLLQRGAGAGARDQAGCTPLDLVTSHPWREGADREQLQDLRSLLHASEERALRPGWASEVLECTRSGDAASLSCLLSELRTAERGAGHVASSALLCAATFGHQQISSQLIVYGADINAVGNEGLTPLMLAATHGHVGVCRELLAAGADVHVRCGAGRTAFELASLAEDVPAELLRLLAHRTLAPGRPTPLSPQPQPASLGPPSPQPQQASLGPVKKKKGASSLPGSPNYLSSGRKIGWPYSPMKVKPKDLMEKIATSPNPANSQSTPKKVKQWMSRVSSTLAHLNGRRGLQGTERNDDQS